MLSIMGFQFLRTAAALCEVSCMQSFFFMHAGKFSQQFILPLLLCNMLLQVELFCVNHLINCSLESTEEFICMEFRFTLRDNGMQAAFELLHMVLEVPHQ